MGILARVTLLDILNLVKGWTHLKRENSYNDDINILQEEEKKGSKESTLSKNFKKAWKKKYKENWVWRTILMLVLPFLNLLVLTFLTLFKTKNMYIVINTVLIDNFLKVGSLFTISLSLITNLFKDKKEVASENEYFLKIINIFSIVIVVFICLSIGAAYDDVNYKLILDERQAGFSIALHLLTTLSIAYSNYFNRTDDINDVVTNGGVDKVISKSVAFSELEGLDLE